MKTGHIYIYGIISPYQDDDAGKWGEVNIKDVQNQIKNNQEADELIVHINSPGGDVNEGFAIHDILKISGKKITTQGEGLIASIATVIFLSGEVRKITENSELLIHNPWGFAGGESKDIQKYADQLTEIEDKLAKFYEGLTSLSYDEAKEAMTKETVYNSDEAVNLGFATEKMVQLKAVAKLNINKKRMEQNNEQVKKELNSINNAIEKLKKFVGLGDNPKNIIIQDVEGTEIDFSTIETMEQLQVGLEATIDGSPATGERVLEDGRTLVFEAGTLTEIKEAEGDEEETLDTLKAEIEELKAENETLKAENKTNEEAVQAKQEEFDTFKQETEVKINALMAEFETFKGKYSNGFVPNGGSAEEEKNEKTTARKAFKTKEE